MDVFQNGQYVPYRSSEVQVRNVFFPIEVKNTQAVFYTLAVRSLDAFYQWSISGKN